LSLPPLARPPLPRVTGREIVRALNHLGWVLVVQKGSDAQLKHPEPRRVPRCSARGRREQWFGIIRACQELCARHGTRTTWLAGRTAKMVMPYA